MEQQQQQQQQQPAPALGGRPWFRLGSMIRGDPTPAPPQPQPQPTLRQPLIRTQTILPGVPTAPPTTRPTGGTASMPPSPVLRPTSAGGASSVPQSPRAPARRVPQSPPQQQTRPTINGTSTGAGGTGGTSSVPQSPRRVVPKQQTEVGGAASLPGSPQAQRKPVVSSLPSSPQTTTAAAATTVPGGVSSVPQSPPPPPPKAAAVVPSPKTIKSSTSPAPAPKSPPASPLKTTGKPRADQSPVRSPKTIKPSSPPPPLRLPSPQLKPADHPEPETKRLFDPKPHYPSSPPKQIKPAVAPTYKVPEPAYNHHHHGLMKSNISSYSAGRNLSDEEETAGMRVITIAGENKGAIMELMGRRFPNSSTSKKKPSVINPNPAVKDLQAADIEEKKKLEKDKKTNKAALGTAAPMSAFVNSNVQSVNNSILFNASCAVSSPGVHLALSRHPSGTRKVEHYAPDGTGHDHRHHS